VPSDTDSLARCTPAVMGKGAEGQEAIIEPATTKYDCVPRIFLQGKRSYSAPHDVYNSKSRAFAKR
jgi:hypothetical protein